MPDIRGADLSAEAGVLIYLEELRAVVELEGCFYTVDRALSVDFSSFDLVTLLIELPLEQTMGSEVYIYEDGEVVDAVSASSTLSYVMDSSHELGFELSTPAAAPTGPIIVAKPSGDNPKPK